MDKAPVITVSTQQFIIALGVLALVAAILVGIGFLHVPTGNERVLDVVVGNIMGIAGTVAGFYYPSSIGARAKDETIQKLTELAAPSSPPTGGIV